VQALDLRVQRPRGPRVQLAGVTFTARVIDKLRASLPGGNLNGYFESNGFSLVWQRLSGISLDELRSQIAQAEAEEHVVAWVDQQLRENGIDRDEANARMEAVTPTSLSAAWQQVFAETYPATLRDRCSNAFDLFEADDERIYGADAARG
jgi:hypothetical protein